MVSAAEHVGFCEPHAMLASSIHVLYRNIYSSAFCLIPVDSWVLRPGHLAQHAPPPLPTGCQWRTEVCRFLVCGAWTEHTLQMPLYGDLSHALCCQQHHTMCAHTTAEDAHGERSLSTFPLPHASCQPCTSNAVSCTIIGQHIDTSCG